MSRGRIAIRRLFITHVASRYPHKIFNPHCIEIFYRNEYIYNCDGVYIHEYTHIDSYFHICTSHVVITVDDDIILDYREEYNFITR